MKNSEFIPVRFEGSEVGRERFGVLGEIRDVKMKLENAGIVGLGEAFMEIEPNIARIVMLDKAVNNGYVFGIEDP